jgi:hypothetical protein
MLKYEIDRRTWYRGCTSGDSKLWSTKYEYNGEPMKCCLGFDGLACGILEEYIVDMAEPEAVGQHTGNGANALPGLIFWPDDGDLPENTPLAHLMMRVNDTPVGSSAAIHRATARTVEGLPEFLTSKGIAL